MSPLTRAAFDTRKLPPGIGSDAWQKMVGLFVEARPKGDPAEFFSSLDAWMIGDIVIGRSAASAQDFSRSPVRAARDGMDGYLLVFLLAGHIQSYGAEAGFQAVPGDLIVVDLARGAASSTTETECISLLVPRRLLGPLIHVGDIRNMLRLDGGLPLVVLLRQMMLAIFDQGEKLDTEQADALISPLLRLAAAAIDSAPATERDRGANRALYADLCAFIEEKLDDAGLSGALVARAFGISRATLYRLFSGSGGFQRHLQEKRLLRCRQALTDPARFHLPIAEVARAHGFANPTGFSRTFRQHFGLTAREVRALARQGHGSTLSTHFHGTTIEDWITRLR